MKGALFAIRLFVALYPALFSAQDPFWTAIDFSAAQDLGHRPQPVA